MSQREHALSLMLPITVTIIVPAIFWYLGTGIDPWFLWPAGFELLIFLVGGLLLFSGMLLLFGTIQQFAKEGEGTLSPLHPTQNLVVSGVYGHVRNPMISGVVLILLGESILFFSFFVFAWFLFFFIGNHVYFIKSEEPGLVERFGNDYILYTENVPRWIPQRRPWSSSSQTEDGQEST